MSSAPTTLRRLGTTSLPITSIGLGVWQFSEGKGMAGAFWPALGQTTANDIVAAALEGGINWFDTAEIYGKGASERCLARALSAAQVAPGDVFIATKWWPAMRRAGSIADTFGAREEALGGFPVDLHQVHQPLSLSSVKAQMHAMADLLDAGKIRAVGVSNFSAKKMLLAHEALAGRGYALASNQVKFNLLDRTIEKDGVLAAAKEINATIIAYSPLEQGLLSGKFHRDPGLIRDRPGPRKWLGRFRKRGLERSRPLIAALEEIGTQHAASATSVALAWLVQFHGDTVVAIPGATKVHHVRQNVKAMMITLSEDELARIDHLSQATQ